MYSGQQLNTEGIRQWNQIKDEYNSTSILLGNGFSINFSNTLRYRYLYRLFINHCSDPAKKLFEHLKTKNFEHVLASIETAKAVCQILEIPTNKFDGFKIEVRQGLIDSINKIHPKTFELDQDKIKWVSLQFKSFNKVFTTNYDIFLYYIILETRRLYSDHFFNPHSAKYKLFGEPDQMYKHHIYYLHGALFLFEKRLETLKILKPEDGTLLGRITDEINDNNYPLFISEGKSESKLKSIRSNSYLSFCLNKLENNSDDTLIVYGQSLHTQDKHIAKILDTHYKKLAISINTDDWSPIGKLRAEKNRISSLFSKAKYEFFDAKTLFDFEPKFLIK